ncbi:TPA: hypothetical protein VDV67_006124 [Pseudomonas aeruginosa]|nr:hypothetical protein [Pseudomonas aeruginosa]
MSMATPARISPASFVTIRRGEPAMKKRWKAVIPFVAVALALGFLALARGGERPSDPYVLAVAALLLVFALWYDRKLARDGYWQRITENRAAIYSVLLNGVEVGSLRDAEYARIQLEVMNDWRVYAAQVVNVGRVPFKVAGKVCFVLPILIFWLLAGVALFTPEVISESITHFQSAGPQALSEAMRGLLLIAALAFAVAASFMLLTGYSFGFKSQFSAAVHDRLRRHCNTPAEGKIVLVGVATVPAPGQPGRVTS